MRWLRWLGLAADDEDPPIELREAECWRVEGTKDAAGFYRSLVHVASPGSIVYLEDTTDKRVPAFLESRRVPDHRPVKRGTILPRADRHHVPATPENLQDLAALIVRDGIRYPAIHTHLYKGEQVLVEWYDAFSGDPIYVSATVPEASVARFASGIGSAYSWAKRGG